MLNRVNRRINAINPAALVIIIHTRREKYNWPLITAACIDRTCVVVTALCNQPEVFASDLGNDQSCYLYASSH